MAELQSGEGRIVIDLVVWAQYINVTDSHVATAIAALTQRVRAAKTVVLYILPDRPSLP